MFGRLFFRVQISLTIGGAELPEKTTSRFGTHKTLWFIGLFTMACYIIQKKKEYNPHMKTQIIKGALKKMLLIENL